MAKVINMGALPFQVNTEVFTSLIQAIQHRVPVLKQIDQSDLQYNFLVEEQDQRDLWLKFYEDIWPVISNEVNEFMTISEDHFHKANWFIYFFGSFYKYKGAKEDRKYVAGTYMYLTQKCGYIEDNFDTEALYYKAFPKPC